MVANIGEMFYTGDTPWHGLGVALAQPADLDEALKVGGLNWRVDEVDLFAADDPPSLVKRRKALVRSDCIAGDERRVLGVAHRGFKPIQNRDAGMLFDSIFGQGRPYALLANSHDGSMAFSISLTTVRVVCQNTLNLAMKEKIGTQFRRAHQGSFREHAVAAKCFLKQQCMNLTQSLSRLLVFLNGNAPMLNSLIFLWPWFRIPKNPPI